MNKQKQKTIKFTSQGLQELKGELKKLQDRLPAVIKRVATARELGDLAENAEYHAAREDHSWIQGRIEELEAILSRAEVIEQSNGDSVSLGNQVVLVNKQGDEVEYHIVGQWEADPQKQKISHESPIGQALVGKKVNEKVEVQAPAGKITYTVKQVK